MLSLAHEPRLPPLVALATPAIPRHARSPPDDFDPWVGPPRPRRLATQVPFAFTDRLARTAGGV